MNSGCRSPDLFDQLAGFSQQLAHPPPPRQRLGRAPAVLERVPVAPWRAGMQRAKAQGRHTGRPPLHPMKRRRIAARLAETPRPSDRAIARAVGVAPETVAKVRRSLGADTPGPAT